MVKINFTILIFSLTFSDFTPFLLFSTLELIKNNCRWSKNQINKSLKVQNVISNKEVKECTQNKQEQKEELKDS